MKAVKHSRISKASQRIITELSAVHTNAKLDDTFAFDVGAYRKLVRSESSTFWQRAGERKALKLFQKAAQCVPAYKDFLRKNNVLPETVKTIQDLAQVPYTTKENYIKAYPLTDRSWDGVLSGHGILAVSSGTSGEPTMWPRGAVSEREALLTHEFLLTELHEIDTYKTLMIIGFPMGMYVSGVATAVPSLLASFTHPNLTIATVGYNKGASIDLIKSTGKYYEQIILVGHPFYIKDLIETGTKKGINWKKGPRVHTFMCSEGFNEVWRDYVGDLVGAQSPERAVFNTLGSSEFLLTGYETPLTIKIRQDAEDKSSLATGVFGSDLVPNVFQYNPLMRFIQVAEKDKLGGDLCITADAGIPLIRFNQHDSGNVMDYDEVLNAYSKNGGSTVTEGAWHLPFVTFYGRSDRTLKFYAANIYPEHVSTALDTAGLLPKVTGKFVMDKKLLPNKDQYLEVHIEMRDGIKPSIALMRAIQNTIVKTLEHLNREYLFLRTNLKKDMLPRVILHEEGAGPHFNTAGKTQFIARHKSPYTKVLHKA